MITEFLVGLASDFIVWLAGLFGPWIPPAELEAMSDGVEGVLLLYSGLGVWVEWPVVNACIAAATATALIVWGIKLLRAVLAHVPAFGGAGD